MKFPDEEWNFFSITQKHKDYQIIRSNFCDYLWGHIAYGNTSNASMVFYMKPLLWKDYFERAFKLSTNGPIQQLDKGLHQW